MEIWKPVKSLYRFNSKYEIVSKIDIADGYFISTKGNLSYKGKLRNNKPEPKGYIQDYLYGDDGKRYRFKRHQIVMQTFNISGYKDGYTVDHIDRNTENNDICNLRWASWKTQVKNKDNTEYKYKPVFCINELKEFHSCQEAEDYYGLVHNTVSRVARGERKSIHGLRFCYANNKCLEQETAQMNIYDFMGGS